METHDTTVPPSISIGKIDFPEVMSHLAKACNIAVQRVSPTVASFVISDPLISPKAKDLPPREALTRIVLGMAPILTNSIAPDLKSRSKKTREKAKLSAARAAGSVQQTIIRAERAATQQAELVGMFADDLPKLPPDLPSIKKAKKYEQTRIRQMACALRKALKRASEPENGLLANAWQASRADMLGKISELVAQAEELVQMERRLELASKAASSSPTNAPKVPDSKGLLDEVAATTSQPTQANSPSEATASAAEGAQIE